MFTKHTAAWPEEKSLAKSAAIMTRPDTHFDWVRPGIMLYGISPFLDRTGADLGLKPVMTLKSRLVRIDRRHKGANIGYGAQTAAPEDMDVGIVAIGYADGYPRHIQAPAPVLVNQAQAYSIGRIAMDLMMIDLRTAPRATVGDEVTLWGVNAPIEHVARAANTIPYTLTTAIAARVQRHYLGSQEDELKWVKKL
jgi:alanine racemase